MNAIELIVLNFEEVRRRSKKIWMSIPEGNLDWRPDSEAMSCWEMIGHVLESEYMYHQILKNHGSVSLEISSSPYESRRFATVEEALAFAQPYREQFLTFVKSFSDEDLTNLHIDRSDVGYVRSLGDMLLRIAYHESVHAGQILDYLRTADVDRQMIWD